MRRGGRLGQRGQALTELALLSIILIMILLGADDFARLYQQNTALQEAAREGARHAAWYSSGTNSNPYLADFSQCSDPKSIVSVVFTVMQGAGLATTCSTSVIGKSSAQCPANGGAYPPDPSQIWVYMCTPTATSACPGAPAGSGQDVEVAVLTRFNLVVQSSLFFGPDFPVNGDSHFRVQGC